MKILRHGNLTASKMEGTCKCGCRVQCKMSETKQLIDRDTQPGMATRYVECPECHAEFLWVKRRMTVAEAVELSSQ